MFNTIFAKKITQKQMYSEAGKRLGVTVLEVPAHSIYSLKTKEKNGYNAIAIKLGTGKVKEVRVNAEDLANFKTDQPLVWSDMLKVGDAVTVTGTSKGKGFAGVVKRYHFKGGPRTHGQSDRERARGSSGPTTTPGRVLPGKRMAGRMGNDTVTISGLEVIAIDPEKNLVTINGSVPGKKTGLVRIARSP